MLTDMSLTTESEVKDESPYEDKALKFISSMFEESNEKDDGVFYFETDYLALKGNPDYLKLMKTLAVLEVQRIKVCQDLEKLEILKIRAEEEPEKVKNEILEGKASYLSRCSIHEVPEIDWTKYKGIDFDGKISTLTTRRMAKSDVKPVKVENEKKDDSKIRVRGRVYTESKPETFNQLWTVEEQLRLEALLVEFPPEPVESRRWKKIADALGNRTSKQVCSRVQKYFKKLRKAGISVPGRIRHNKSVKPAHIHKRHKHYLYRPTTFFPGAAMKELGDSDSEESSSRSGGSMDSQDLTHWVDILAQIKEEKENEGQAEQVKHFGYKCASCKEDPIVGIKWECSRCPGFLMCSDCLAGCLESEPPIHPISHVFNPVKIFSNPYYKAEYVGATNYLDPNFA